MAPRRSTVRTREAQNNQHQEEQIALVSPNEVPAKEREAYWLGLVNDLSLFRESVKTIEFFRLVNELPPSLWERALIIYAYRLEPAVRNEKGPKYMDKLTRAVDEQYFKEVYGGGKYLLYLKCGEESIKEITFAIDGPAKLQPNMVLVDSSGNPLPAAAPAAAPSTQSSEMKQVIDATSAASSAATDLLKKGFEGVVDAQNELMKKNLGLGDRSNGGGIQDKLIAALIEKALNPPNPMDMLTQVLAVVKQITPPAPPVVNNPQQNGGSDMAGSIGLIKELYGVESLHELGDLVKGKNETPWYASVAQTIFEKGPTILAQLADLQRDNWNRAMAMRGQPQPMMRPIELPGSTASHPGQTIPGAAAPAAGNVVVMSIGEAVPRIVAQIADSFDRGFDGGDSAAALDINFRDIIEKLAPMLGNPQTLSEFIASVPILAEQSKHPEWAEFQQNFIEYILDKYPLEEKPAAAGPIPVPHVAATVVNAPPANAHVT